jgi:predicted DCC family thiol-disulfide oxidoreductase YuxK
MKHSPSAPSVGTDIPEKRFSWAHNFSADPRALGLFRIFFGLICLWDLLRRVPYIDIFYSNEGVLSNHYGLFTQMSTRSPSVMNALSAGPQVTIFFALLAICLICFTLGYRTRLFQVLCAIGMISLHSRNTLVENGGDVVMNIWWVWTFFLPLGRRLSIDALRKSLNGYDKSSSVALNRPEAPDRLPVWSLAVFAIAVQLSVIYFFNTVHKHGDTWADATALAWVLEQDRIVRPFGRWIQEALPLGVTQFLSWATLVVEGAAPLLILSPFFTSLTRRIAFISLAILHLGIFATVDVGLFSWNMMVIYLLLLTSKEIDTLRRWLMRLAGPPIRVYYDSDCGVCHLSARIIVRLDRLGLIHWVGRDPNAEIPPCYKDAEFAELRERTIIVWDEKRQRSYVRHLAFARILSALPLGRLFSWLLSIPGLSQLAGWSYDRFSASRHTFSAWIGLGACGLKKPQPVEASEIQESNATLAVRKTGWWTTQAIVLVFIVAASSQMMIENGAFRVVMKVNQPSWCRDIVDTFRIFQGWSMFAKDAPRTDGWMVIDAELDDGRHIDPQTGEAPRFTTADYRYRRLPHPWPLYTVRIAGSGSSRYRNELKSWLENRRIPHLKLGKDEKIRRFTIWWIDDKSPTPGSGESAKETKRTKILEGGRKS